MRRWFLIVAVVLVVTGAVPVSAADDDFECDGEPATNIGTGGDDELVDGTDTCINGETYVSCELSL